MKISAVRSQKEILRAGCPGMRMSFSSLKARSQLFGSVRENLVRIACATRDLGCLVKTVASDQLLMIRYVTTITTISQYQL